MDKKQKNTKKILSHESIYKIMQWLPVAVASLFFLKNIGSGDAAALVTIGVTLAVFVGMLVFVKVRKVSLYIREFTLAIALPFLVFIISLNSGASYSDDFSLFLAVMALTGLYLEPQFTKIQIVIVDILLVIMYMVHPEKAGDTSQFILCVAVFNFAAVLFQMVIKRGRAFIEIGEERAAESEKLLETVRNMGTELKRDFAESSAKIETSTKELHAGSVSITQEAGNVSENCLTVRDKIKETEEEISRLNEEVKQFESALDESKNNVKVMNEQVDSVSDIITQSGAVFRTMEGQMNEVAKIAKQINDISFKLTILSLNASVEAARAGESGVGFQVLASEMRELSENSNDFSTQVAEVVEELLGRVEETSKRFTGSEEALAESEKTMDELVGSMDGLHQQFERLYDNIERQNANVNQINYIFDDLNQKVADMHSNSLENQDAVEDIVNAMMIYRENVDKIVENTQSV